MLKQLESFGLTRNDPAVKDFSAGADVGSARGLFKITEEN